MEGTKCPTNGGDHDFSPFLVATLPPDAEQLKAADVASFTSSEGATQVIAALTAKRFVVACNRCGLVIGYHVAEPEA